jgi:hypothetical protein
VCSSDLAVKLPLEDFQVSVDPNTKHSSFHIVLNGGGKEEAGVRRKGVG